MQDDLLAVAAAAFKLPANLSEQTVLSVHHWTDRLFSLTMTRDPGFRFENGQFVMIGLPVDGKPLLRAYSMASPNHCRDAGIPQHQGAGRAADVQACSTCRLATRCWSAASRWARCCWTT